MKNMMSCFKEGDIMKDFSGIEFASEHNGTDVFRLIELAYEQGQKDGHSEQLGTNLDNDVTVRTTKEREVETLRGSAYMFRVCIRILRHHHGILWG